MKWGEWTVGQGFFFRLQTTTQPLTYCVSTLSMLGLHIAWRVAIIL